MIDFGQEIFTPESGVKELCHMEGSYTSFAEKEKYFKSVNVDTIEDFDMAIMQCLRCKELAYRGVKEAKFRLQTSSQIAYDRKCKKKSYNPTKGGYQDFVLSTLSRIKNLTRMKRILKSQNLPINDFLYLALLQHYGYPSPLLDFSYDIKSALFLMLDGLTTPKNVDDKNDINNYCSLYAYWYNDPELRTLQDVYTEGGARAEILVRDAISRNIKIDGISEQMKRSFKELPYEELKEMRYLGVHGHALGGETIEIPSCNFKTSIDINNPRIEAQFGMFVFLGDAFKSLEKTIAEQSSYKHILVYNVNKNLAPLIKEKYLNDVKRTDIYLKDKISRRIICALRSTPCLYSMDFYKSNMSWTRFWIWKMKNDFPIALARV